VTGYDVGYGKPPKHSQFKKGVCPNPQGRGKRGELPLREILDRVLNAKTNFRERGKLKKASRLELTIRWHAALAIKGDVSSAALLLKLRAHAEKHPGASSPTIITIIGGPPYLRRGPLPRPSADRESQPSSAI
jgi:Family of unknown function (DUF5681)